MDEIGLPRTKLRRSRRKSRKDRRKRRRQERQQRAEERFTEAAEADLALPTEEDYDAQLYRDEYGYGNEYYYDPYAPAPYDAPYYQHPQAPATLDLSEFDVPTADEYYAEMLPTYGSWELVGASARLDDGDYGAVFIGQTRSGRIVGRCIAGDRDEAARGALEEVRDGALDVAEEHPYVRAATKALKGLRKLLRKKAGNRRPRVVEDDEALDLVGLARHAEVLRCR